MTRDDGSREALAHKVATVPNLRIRLPDEGGVFVVFRAGSEEAIANDKSTTEAQALRSVSRPFAAYWYDMGDGTMYIYGRLVFDAVDVGQSLLALTRDFGVDPFALDHVKESFILNDALVPGQSMSRDDTRWLPVTRETIVKLLHVDPGEITPIEPGTVARPPGGGCSYCQDIYSPRIGGGAKSAPGCAGEVSVQPSSELTEGDGSLHGGEAEDNTAKDEDRGWRSLEDVEAVEEDQIAAEQVDNPFEGAIVVIIAGCCPSCCAPHMGTCSPCQNGTCCDNLCCLSCCGNHCCAPGQNCCNGSCCAGDQTC